MLNNKTGFFLGQRYSNCPKIRPSMYLLIGFTMPDLFSTVEHNYSIRRKTIKNCFAFGQTTARINIRFYVYCFFSYIIGLGNFPHFKVKSTLSIIRSGCSASCENGKQF